MAVGRHLKMVLSL